MGVTKPKRLEPGATIGIVAPSSGLPDPAPVDTAVDTLRRMGFAVKVGRAVRGRLGFLSAGVAERVRDLHAMFADPRVDGIMCMRGGYGAMHLLPHIDYDLVARNPKVFTGFSDITALGLAFLRRAGLATFNGPMAVSTFAKQPPSMFSTEGFLRTVTIARPAGSVWMGHAEEEAGARSWRVVTPGSAEGRLVGGNLSLVAALAGTPFGMRGRGNIVFLEEVEEKPYRMDRMLTQLLLAGELQEAAGIVIGRNVPDPAFEKLEQERAAAGLPRRAAPTPRRAAREYEQSMDEIIAERLGGLGIPVMIGLPFGHVYDSATLPLGVRAAMDTRTGELALTESAVR